MTKTTNLLLFLTIATILIVSPLASESVFADPKENHEDKKDKKSKTGEHKLKCKSIGSFFTPSPDVFSSSEGKCSAGLSHVSTASVSSAAPYTGTGCLTLTSVGDDFAIGKKGFVMLTSTGEQCFFDETGASTLPLPGTFCTVGGPHTSTVTGTYTITGGLVKDTTVDSGSGTFVSEANHCDSKAPYGNSFTTKLTGSIIFQ
jgi:hypothetical protein